MEQALADALQDTVSELELAQSALESLRSEYETVYGDFVRLKYNNVDNVWRYFPAHCPEFQFLPVVDLVLAESVSAVGDYTLGQTIGQGQFSSVRKCFKARASGDVAMAQESSNLAVKVIQKSSILSIDGVLKVERELKALHTLGSAAAHPNIVQYKECLHGRRALYIVTEEVPLDLFEFMKCFRGHLNGNMATVIIRNLVEGLRFMHGKCISHGDVKPENILVDIRRNNQIIVKLCDFGLCSHLSPRCSMVNREFSGTSGFYAPETLVSPDYCGYKADIFSLGCVCMELLLSPDNFRLLWLSSYTKAKIVSKSYAAANPRINVEFVCDIKTTIESLGAVLQDSNPVGSDHGHKMLMAILNFHPGSRPSLRSSEIVTWVDTADETIAYNAVSHIVNSKKLALSKVVGMETVKRGPSKRHLCATVSGSVPSMWDKSLSLLPMLSTADEQSPNRNQSADNLSLPSNIFPHFEGPECSEDIPALDGFRLAGKNLLYRQLSANQSTTCGVPRPAHNRNSSKIRRGATEVSFLPGTKLSTPVKGSVVSNIEVLAESSGMSGRGFNNLSGTFVCATLPSPLLSYLELLRRIFRALCKPYTFTKEAEWVGYDEASSNIFKSL